MGKIRITALVENSVEKRRLLAEHGLSFWIELESANILFDTGQGLALRHNARQLGIDLEEADAIALSHGHYDHTGGLEHILQDSNRKKIYVHPAAMEPKFVRDPDGTGREIGVPLPSELKARYQAEPVWVEAPTELPGGLRLTGPVPRKSGFEGTGGAFFLDKECTQPDILLDDQSAFLETPAGTVVILGCAHSGLVNTLDYVSSLTGGRPIHTVVGGTHLLNASQERLDKTVEALRCLDVRRLCPCHCSGLMATARLWREFPDRCESCHVGKTIELAW